MNGKREWILAVLAVVSQIGVIAIAVAAWFSPPQDMTVVVATSAFLQNQVLTVIGYFTGASAPDREATRVVAAADARPASAVAAE